MSRMDLHQPARPLAEIDTELHACHGSVRLHRAALRGWHNGSDRPPASSASRAVRSFSKSQRKLSPLWPWRRDFGPIFSDFLGNGLISEGELVLGWDQNPAGRWCREAQPGHIKCIHPVTATQQGRHGQQGRAPEGPASRAQTPDECCDENDREPSGDQSQRHGDGRMPTKFRERDPPTVRARGAGGAPEERQGEVASGLGARGREGEHGRMMLAPFAVRNAQPPCHAGGANVVMSLSRAQASPPCQDAAGQGSTPRRPHASMGSAPARGPSAPWSDQIRAWAGTVEVLDARRLRLASA